VKVASEEDGIGTIDSPRDDQEFGFLDMISDQASQVKPEPKAVKQVSDTSSPKKASKPLGKDEQKTYDFLLDIYDVKYKLYWGVAKLRNHNYTH
jgi:hypothetical protein